MFNLYTISLQRLPETILDHKEKLTELGITWDLADLKADAGENKCYSCSSSVKVKFPAGWTLRPLELSNLPEPSAYGETTYEFFDEKRDLRLTIIASLFRVYCRAEFIFWTPQLLEEKRANDQLKVERFIIENFNQFWTRTDRTLVFFYVPLTKRDSFFLDRFPKKEHWIGFCEPAESHRKMSTLTRLINQSEYKAPGIVNAEELPSGVDAYFEKALFWERYRRAGLFIQGSTYGENAQKE